MDPIGLSRKQNIERLLHLAATIEQDYQVWDGARELWRDGLSQPSHERSGRPAKIIKRLVDARQRRAAAIRDCGEEAPQAVASLLYHAATRLEAGGRDVPKLLADAAAALKHESHEKSQSVSPTLDLNDCEAAVVQALRENGDLRGEEIAQKAGYLYNSHLRNTLSSLTKRGIIANTPARGYYLA